MRLEILAIVSIWDLIRDFFVKQYSCLIRPASGHIFNRVATSAQNHNWNSKVASYPYSFGMRLY